MQNIEFQTKDDCYCVSCYIHVTYVLEGVGGCGWVVGVMMTLPIRLGAWSMR